MRLVVDASALIAYLLQEVTAGPLRSILRGPSADLHVPALCDIEVASVLRTRLLSHVMHESRAAEATADYLQLPLTRHGHEALLGRILELRENFSPYDATYVALTERLQATLVTMDAALARAVRRHLSLPVLP